jgi:hypothetical protein
MTPLVKTPTLRQLAASALRIVGHSSTTLARAECAFTKELVRLGLAERGHPGRGGSRSPRATIEHAEILTLAIALGIPAKQAVAEALALRTLPIESSTRWFIWPSAVITEPLPIKGLEGGRFRAWSL